MDTGLKLTGDFLDGVLEFALAQRSGAASAEDVSRVAAELLTFFDADVAGFEFDDEDQMFVEV